ncbi:TolC family protein [Chitinophagaceae bacterium LWZ2-11]
MLVVYKRTAISCIGILMLVLSAVGANAQKTVYSLSELVDSASKYLPALREKQALVNSARAGVIDAKHAYLPKLNVSDEVSIASANSLAGTYFPIAPVPSTQGSITAENNSQAATGNTASIYGEYELVNFGLRDAKVNNALAFQNLQQADFNKELYLVKLQIGKIYFDILRNQYQLDVDAQNIDRYQSIYTIIKALTGSGINAGVDSSLAKAELSKTRVSYNQRFGTINQLTQQLSYLTGIAQANINIDTATIKYAVATASMFNNVNDTVNNPLIDYYTKQKKLYQSTETLVKKSYLPKILLAVGGWGRGSSIQYNEDYKALSEGLGYQRYNYGAGVSFTYDLFNGVHKKDRLNVSRYQTQASDFGLQQQKLSLNNAAQQADMAIRTAEQNLQELPIQLQAATDAYYQKMAQYKAGIINLIDLTNASFVLYTAQSNYVSTLNDWYLANLNKAAAIGNLDSFIQTIK